MKLVENWREAKKWFSMHCMGIATGVQGAWIALPDDMRQSVPLWAVASITILILLLGMWGRLIDQSKGEKDGGV